MQRRLCYLLRLCWSCCWHLYPRTRCPRCPRRVLCRSRNLHGCVHPSPRCPDSMIKHSQEEREF
ncbi:hypothetical protein RSAG8_01632, partial [Rhizoctonia solani AG-8 WAC10335]